MNHVGTETGVPAGAQEGEAQPQSAHKWRRWRDLPRAWGAMAGRCPNCGRGRIFRSLWAAHATCAVCGVRFERHSGSWLGAMVIVYAVAVVLLLALAAILIVRWGLFEGLELVLVGAGIVFTVLLYRPSKGLWIWWMWGAGFLTTDDEQAPG